MAAIQTHSAKESSWHVGLRRDRADSSQDLGDMVPHQQETLDQFLCAVRRRARPGLPCALLLGHRYQTLARSLDQAFPHLRKERDHGLHDCLGLCNLAVCRPYAGRWADDERWGVHISAFLRVAGKPQLQLASVLAGLRPDVSAPHLATRSQKDIPEDLKEMDRCRDGRLGRRASKASNQGVPCHPYARSACPGSTT